MAGARGLIPGTHANKPPHGGLARALRKGLAGFYVRNRLFVCIVLWLVALIVVMAGCAVGRNEQTGAVVIGFNAGKLVETGNQAIAGAAGALFGPAGVAVSGGALGLLGIVGKLWASSAAAKAKHEGERAGWEEAQATFSPPPKGTA